MSKDGLCAIVTGSASGLGAATATILAKGGARIVVWPIVNLEVFVPDHYMGDVTGGLASKRARINGTDSLRGGELVVKAQVPLAEVTDYQTELKALTQGQGRYAIEFSHYDPVPAQVQKQLVDAYKPRVEEE